VVRARADASIRVRTEGDLDTCAELARAVRAVDGYPVYLPGEDFRTFLVTPRPIEAWVAADGDGVVGHVALHRRTSPEVTALAAERLGEAPERLAVVARLLVSPDRRREGIGGALLRTAAGRGRRAVLDVVPGLRAAVSLYAACGWRPLGEVHVRLPDGTTVDEIVFAAPVDDGADGA